MTNRKSVNLNQKILFDPDDSDFTDKKVFYSFVDEDGVNTKEVNIKNNYEYRNIDKLLDSSDISSTQKSMIKILYEKGIFDYNEVIQIVKDSLQRNIRVDLSSIAKVHYETNGLSNATIGNALGHYIKFNDINQSKLAQMANIDRTTLFNIIKKPNSVSLINAYKICKILGEDMETLFPFFLEEDTEE